jgi:small-conductance mechanosensitive channel
MFILVRRPYGIGDRIHVSNIEQETDINGSYGWVVENISLLETTAVWTPTRERCSLANGSLAQSRIINGARSPQAIFLVPFKFPISTPYERILVFKAAVEEYMKARPREWLMLTGFRATTIAPDQGFIEYVMHVQHRESWQQFGQLQDSKANFQSFCQEVSDQLGMHYSAPPLPVDLRYSEQVAPRQDNFTSDIDPATRIEGFRSLAMTQHNIGWNGK